MILRLSTFALLCIISFSLLVIIKPVSAAGDNTLNFLDNPLDDPISLPDWFKLSFLELSQDVVEAKENGKKGLIIYFGQELCPYCKAHLENNWGQKDIINYTQKNFDVIAIDVKGRKSVTGLDGNTYNEKTYSAFKKTNFTPSLIFFDTAGREVLRLRGYRQPYQFRAALEYVADNHYRKEAFRKYMARAESAISYGKPALNEHDSINPPPYLLDRSRFAAKQPLLVLFERKHCHACDVLHAEPLTHQAINKKLQQFEIAQIDSESDMPVITPDGKRLTAKEWADDLNIEYTPTLIFFDEHGKEIIRIDAVVWFNRLRNVFDFVLSKAYKKYATFQMWREAKKMR